MTRPKIKPRQSTNNRRWSLIASNVGTDIPGQVCILGTIAQRRDRLTNQMTIWIKIEHLVELSLRCSFRVLPPAPCSLAPHRPALKASPSSGLLESAYFFLPRYLSDPSMPCCATPSSSIDGLILHQKVQPHSPRPVVELPT